MPKSTETRVERLELIVSQQGYVIIILLVVFAFDTAGVLWLWQEKGKPDFDHIAVAMTVFQTLFGIGALYGFWALRGLTRERASEMAEEVALAEVKRLIPSIVAREVRENMEAFRRAGPISDEESAQMVRAFGSMVEGGNGQSNANSRSSSEDSARRSWRNLFRPRHPV